MLTADDHRAKARARYHRRKAEDPAKVARQSIASSAAYDKRLRARPGPKRDAFLASERERARLQIARESPEARRRRLRRAVLGHAARRARVKLAPPSRSDLDYEDVVRRDPCSYCGAAGGQVDHVVPIARGGGCGWENQTAACGSCNSSKGARPLVLFLAERGCPTTTR